MNKWAISCSGTSQIRTIFSLTVYLELTGDFRSTRCLIRFIISTCSNGQASALKSKQFMPSENKNAAERITGEAITPTLNQKHDDKL